MAAGEQYFAVRPSAAHRRRELRFLYRGELLIFETDTGVFGSTALDPGTALLIGVLDPGPAESVLDLGCGWGPIGLAAARRAPQGRILLTDVNRRALRLARRNARQNGLERVEVREGPGYAPVGGERFDLIVTNPPYHAGRPAVLSILDGAPEHLTPRGRLMLVGKGSQGIQHYQHHLAETWPGGVLVRARGSGYRVLEARYASESR